MSFKIRTPAPFEIRCHTTYVTRAYRTDRARGTRLKALPIANVAGTAMRVTRKNFIRGLKGAPPIAYCRATRMGT